MKKISTLFSTYLIRIKATKSHVALFADITTARMNNLCNDQDAKPYADEFYKIIYIANQMAGLGEESFNQAVDEIYPNRVKVDLLQEFKELSPEARFFKKYTQTQREIEKTLGIANGKLSKYYADPAKRALATEIIAFADGMNLDILSVFKEIYGEIELKG